MSLYMNVHQKGSQVLKRYHYAQLPSKFVERRPLRKALNELKSHGELFTRMLNLQEKSPTERRAKCLKSTLARIKEWSAEVEERVEIYEHFIEISKVMYKPQIKTKEVIIELKDYAKHADEHIQQMVNSCYVEVNAFEEAATILFTKCQWLYCQEKKIKTTKAKKGDTEMLCEKETQMQQEVREAFKQFDQHRLAMYSIVNEIEDRLEEEVEMLYPECILLE
jgi:hypothetical protein